MLTYSQEAIDKLVDIIYEKIKERFEKDLNEANVEFSRDGIITAVSDDGSLACVDVGFNILENIPNRSGGDLAEKDKVRVYYDRNTMKNAYIGFKF